MTAEEHLKVTRERALALLETVEDPATALLAFGTALNEHPSFNGNHPSYRRGVTLLHEGSLQTREQVRAFIESVQVNEPEAERFPGAPQEGEHADVIMIRDLRVGNTKDGTIIMQANIRGETITYGFTDAQVGQILEGLIGLKAHEQQPPRSKEKRVFTWDA